MTDVLALCFILAIAAGTVLLVAACRLLGGRK